MVIQACTPWHRISSAESTPDRSTSSWSDHSIRGKLSHLATSGSGWAAECHCTTHWLGCHCCPLKKEQRNLELHEVPPHKDTHGKGHEPISPLTGHRAWFLPFLFSPYTETPLTTRHSQPPEPLHPCCVKVHSPDMLNNPAQSSFSDHHVKTWFAKKLLLGEFLLKHSCIILA